MPVPRLARPAAPLLRRLALAQLRAGWLRGRLDFQLPSGHRERLGPTDGPPDATVLVRDERLFARLVLRGELGAGESFVAGEWTSDDLVGAARAFLRGTAARGVESPLTRLARLGTLRRHRRAANTPAGSQRNIHAHYDLGNAFYRLFLDDATLAYSCAWFGDAAPDDVPLAVAQRAKLERLCDWLALSPSDHLLEIGCGWGGMAIHAAATRGCRVTAITLSREQQALARARVGAAGLADRVAIELRDYRQVTGTFTKIASIEMLEAVGHEYLPAYFRRCAAHLPRGGRLALQTITMPDERFERYRRSVDWMQTYVFPGSALPSLGAIRRAAEGAGFAIVRAEDIGADYAPTLACWRRRFLAAIPEVQALGFDVPFIRTWLLYLAFSEAAFAERTLGDHQLLLQRS